MNLRETVLGAARDAGTDFAAYDRKEDEDLSREQLVQAIMAGQVSIAEIGAVFAKAILEAL